MVPTSLLTRDSTLLLSLPSDQLCITLSEVGAHTHTHTHRNARGGSTSTRLTLIIIHTKASFIDSEETNNN